MAMGLVMLEMMIVCMTEIANVQRRIKYYGKHQGGDSIRMEDRIVLWADGKGPSDVLPFIS